MEVLLRDLEQILAVIDDFTGLHNGIAGKDSQNGLAGDGLAGAGLTHDGQGFAPGKVEVNSPDRLHLAVAGAERDT